MSVHRKKDPDRSKCIFSSILKRPSVLLKRYYPSMLALNFISCLYYPSVAAIKLFPKQGQNLIWYIEFLILTC